MYHLRSFRHLLFHHPTCRSNPRGQKNQRSPRQNLTSLCQMLRKSCLRSRQILVLRPLRCCVRHRNHQCFLSRLSHQSSILYCLCHQDCLENWSLLRSISNPCRLYFRYCPDNHQHFQYLQYICRKCNSCTFRSRNLRLQFRSLQPLLFLCLAIVPIPSCRQWFLLQHLPDQFRWLLHKRKN